MKQSQAKAYLPFIQAAAEGKIIEWNDGRKWREVGEFYSLTGSSPERLRIKPTPREFFVRLCPTKEKPEIEKYKHMTPCSPGCEQILVREVIE